MAVNKNFVVKNGLEVNENLILANADTGRVGVGTTAPDFELDVNGGIGATTITITGFSTFTEGIQVGTSGSTFYVDDTNYRVGVGTSAPEYLLDVRTSVSTGQTGLYVQGDATITGDVNLTAVSQTNIYVSGLSTFVGRSQFDDYVTIQDGLQVVGHGVTTTTLNVTGVSTFAGAADFNGDVEVAGLSTFVGLATFNDYVVIQDGLEVLGYGSTTTTLNVTGVSTLTDNVIVGGGLTVSGISTFGSTVYVGGSSGGAGAATTDYSEVAITGQSPSSFNQTYTRATTGFVLDTGTVSSGNALFHADSNYYYYVASTGTDPEDRIIIWSVEDSSWMTVFDFNDPDFSEGNITNNQALGSSGIFSDTLTANSITADGRSVPEASSDIVYATSGGGGGSGGSGIGVTITTDGNAEFVGVVTAAAFYGDGSNLSGIATELTATIGVSSEGTFVGSGVTDINFATTSGSNIQSVDVDVTSGIATVTINPGVSLGLAIALGG